LKFLTASPAFLDRSKYSDSFLDFLSECLVVSPEQRLSALDLLAHPIFKTQSKIYNKEQQIALTTPLSLV
jgi:serine/threonine protein kinase